MVKAGLWAKLAELTKEKKDSMGLSVYSWELDSDRLVHLHLLLGLNLLETE